MDKISAVLCVIAAVAMITFIEIYLKLDKRRTVALYFLGEMEREMDGWVDAAESLLCRTTEEKAEEFKNSILSYRSIPTKERYKKVEVINRIHKYVSDAVAGGVSDFTVNATGHRLTDDFMSFCSISGEYNTNVIKLNSMLNYKIVAFVGKVMRIQQLEKMNQLTVL